MSIRVRLTLWHTLLLGAVLVTAAVAVYLVIARQLTSELDYEIRLRALSASRALRIAPAAWLDQRPDGSDPGGRGPRGRGPGPGSAPVELPASADLADQALFLQILNTQGEVLRLSRGLSEPLPVPPESLQRALSGQEAHDTIRFGDGRAVLYTAPLLVNGTVVAILQVAAPLQTVDEQLALLQLVLGLVVVAAIGVAAALGWLLVARALRPVDRMTQTAQAIGHSTDLSRRLPVPGERDELRRLAVTFNEMLEQLTRAFENERRFVADASHELRTPLTAIRTNAETLLRGVMTDPREREETLLEIVREADRLSRLVADLLTMARADAGQLPERRPVALDTVLLDVYGQASALRQGVRLELGALEQLEVNGDRDRLKQLVLNLVDNALRYTPAGGTVTLDLVRRDGLAALSVRDTGPGIPAEHLPRIFERFYRVDRGRSRESGGTGLGLAISRWIAEAHGGRIDVESREGVGSTFTVLLPLREAVGQPASQSPAAVRSPSGLPVG